MTMTGAQEFLLPASLDEALAAKAEHGAKARFVAGGTDLVLQARAGRHTPEVLIRLPLTDEAPRRDGDTVHVPALTPLRLLERDALLRETLPLLADAVAQIGSPQIRWAGTLGGNLGNASPAADSAPPLLVYEARLVLASTRGTRELPVREFFTGPGRTELAADEAVVAARVPVPGPGEAAYFRKFGPRGANVISSASLAARFVLAGEHIERALLAAGSVAPRPVRLIATEGALAGLRRADLATAAAVDRVVAVLRGEIAPITDVRGSDWYKLRVVEQSLRQAIAQVAGGEVAA